MGSDPLFQGIFLTQGSNPGLTHCRQIFLLSEPPGKPYLTKITAKQQHHRGLGSSTAAAAAAAKSLQSCPTLCDPREGSPPGPPVPGILQARTLEWVAIAFSSA